MSGSVRTADLAVIGAGPAGVEAAVTAAEHGLDVVLLDENPHAGGQVYRAAPATFPPAGGGPDADAGDALRERLAASPVEARVSERVWSVLARSELAESDSGGPEPSPPATEPGGGLAEEAGFRPGGSARYRIDTAGPDGVRTVFSAGIVLSPGAVERVVPFPGWTLPGVIGLAAATVLIKSQRLLPGRRVVVAGAGPLVPAVAAGIVKAGGTVVAVVVLEGSSDWLRALPRIAAMPRLLARGSGWVARIAAARVPVFFRHSVRSAAGNGELETLTISPVDPAGRWYGEAVRRGERRIVADALAIGHGLTPATDLGRLLRLRHRFARAEGGWRPITDEWGRTSLPHCYVAGDGGGIRGAAAAVESGRMAGIGAALDAERLAPDDASARARRARRAHARAVRFGAAMARLTALRPAMVETIPPDTVVCRCEDVTRREIEDAISEGAVEVNQLKHFTRCGMGPCQGRVCGDVAAEILAARIADDPDEGRSAAGQWTGRAPLRPVSMDDLAGHFDYGEIPIPPPAPL